MISFNEQLKLLVTRKANSILNASMLDTLPQYIFWKDIHSIYLGCNLAFARVAGYTSSDEIIGKTDHDLVWDKHTTEIYIAGDKQTMAEMHTRKNLLEPIPVSQKNQGVVLGSKSPIIDDVGNLLGVLGCYTLVETSLSERSILRKINPADMPTLLHLINKTARIQTTHRIAQITIRETEVLLYLLIGKRQRLIAEILNISPRTVETHIEHIKNKLSCNKLTQVIDKAIRGGFLENFSGKLLQIPNYD